MNLLATRESAHKNSRIEEKAHEHASKVIGAARIRRRPKFIPIEPKKKKTSGNEKKEARQKSAVQVLGERVERYDFLKSITCRPAGITFERIENVMSTT